jgi:hypothetical protein
MVAIIFVLVTRKSSCYSLCQGTPVSGFECEFALLLKKYQRYFIRLKFVSNPPEIGQNQASNV